MLEENMSNDAFALPSLQLHPHLRAKPHFHLIEVNAPILVYRGLFCYQPLIYQSFFQASMHRYRVQNPSTPIPYSVDSFRMLHSKGVPCALALLPRNYVQLYQERLQEM